MSVTPDIVERLQTHAMRSDSPIAAEAANTITTLRAKLEKAREAFLQIRNTTSKDNRIMHGSGYCALCAGNIAAATLKDIDQ